ncbi:hypothetical protein [Flavisphingomonas formosensis]|uniref:hypothetical protein n=1 Tax=Flavisphingomonas formosensis TaxID=861534 RepID=UPI0012FB7BD1|nr:hypothetical protein [Sphingomonas formosensis]
MRKRSRSQRIAVRVARAAPWLLTLSSPAALALLASATGALAGLVIVGDVAAPPPPRPGYPINPAHRTRLAQPLAETQPEKLPALALPPPPRVTWIGPTSFPGAQQAGFRWTLEAGLRDAAHCPSITAEFHQGCIDAIAARLASEI